MTGVISYAFKLHAEYAQSYLDLNSIVNSYSEDTTVRNFQYTYCTEHFHIYILILLYNTPTVYTIYFYTIMHSLKYM